MVKKSITVSFRLPQDLVEDIDFLRETFNLDRGTYIKNALSEQVERTFDVIKEEAIKDYINLIIDEDELKDFLEKDKKYKIPKDIQEARARKLKGIGKIY
jgi:predicted DNA-binding protein